MDLLATILAGLIILFSPFLLWLRGKERERYSRDLEEIRTLVDERSRSIESLHVRFDTLDTETEETNAHPNPRSDFHSASSLFAMSQAGVVTFNYLRHYALLQEHLSNLYPVNSQDWWQAMQKSGVNVVPAASWGGRHSTRVMAGAWSTFQSSDPRRIARGIVGSQKPPERGPYKPSTQSPYANTG